MSESVFSLIERYNIQPQKKKGQNFLIDHNILAKIIEAAQLTKKDIVLEAGPGLGVLTEQLVQHAKHVIAVEIDKNLIAILQERFAAVENLSLIQDDVLKIDRAKLFERTAKTCTLKPAPYCVVANIPYNISSRFFRIFLEEQPRPDRMVVLVQREVAERMMAKPPDMNLLAVSVQYFSEAKILFRVSANCFFPKPKVESAVVELRVRKQSDLLPFKEQEFFFKLVRAGFSSKRKYCVSNVAKAFNLPTARAKEAFERANLNIKSRAEELSVEEWKRLVRFIVF